MRLVHVAESPSEIDFANDFRDLLRSVGYEVTGDSDDPPDHSIVIAGRDNGESAAAITRIVEAGWTGALVVVLRPGHGDAPPRSRARLIDGSGTVYDVLARTATALGLDVRTDVFLSYARADAPLADELTAALLDRGRRPWVDRRSLEPSDKWLEALRRGIEASDTFLYLATPSSVRSQWCTQELMWADEMGKRILPVVVHPVASSDIPEPARSRQHIEISEGAIVEQRVDAIVAALDRDPQIVRMHRDILEDALEWKRDPAHVLRGAALRDAEEWLVAASGMRDVRPTELHARYIAASRQAQRKRQRVAWSVAVAVLILIAGLAIWALFNAREARQKAAEARSRLAEQNAFGSYIESSADPIRAFLLADAALRSAPEADPLRTAYDAMVRNLLPQLPESVTNLEAGILVAAVSPNRERVFVRSSGNRTFIAPLTGRPGTKITLSDPEPFLQFLQARFSNDGRFVAAIVRPFFDRSASHRLVVWRAGGEHVGTADLAALSGERSPEIAGFSQDGKRILLQSGGARGQYGSYAIDVGNLKAPVTTPLFRAPSLLLLGQVDIESSTAAIIRGDEAQLIDAFTGRPRCGGIRPGGVIRQVVLGRGGRSLAVVTAAAISSWRLEGQTLRPVGNALPISSNVRVWDIAADGSMAVLLNEAASYPAERWSFLDGRRVSIPVSNRVASPFIMKSGEEYRTLSFVGDRWLLVREPLRDPLQGGRVQQFLLFDRHTLELAAAPFFLDTGYLALEPARDSTRFAVITHEGWVQEWDLLRRQLPGAQRLDAGGLLLDAQFSRDRARIITRTRIQSDTGYASRLDVWNATTAKPAGRFGDLFDVRTEWCQSSNGRLLATASREEKGYAVSLWDASTLKQIWTQHSAAPVEAIAFRAGDTRLVTGGISDDELRRIHVVEYDVGTAKTSYDGDPPLKREPVHVAFSVDGEMLIADYQYDAISFWQLESRAPVGQPYRFNDAAGMRFDLAYDIIRNLRNIRAENGLLSGDLSGDVTVMLRPEGEGTALLSRDSETPVLSAFTPREENLYPVRGADLLSPSGRWFAMGTNVTSVDRASALRVYDLVSGYPVTGLLIHFAAARPDDSWPRLLTTSSAELDPVIALAFLEDEGTLVTVTTNAIVRRWPVLRRAADTPFWSRPEDLAAALTGLRLISARAVQRIPQTDYVRLRARLMRDIEDLP